MKFFRAKDLQMVRMKDGLSRLNASGHTEMTEEERSGRSGIASERLRAKKSAYGEVTWVINAN
jgi:hypothetical protein